MPKISASFFFLLSVLLATTSVACNDGYQEMPASTIPVLLHIQDCKRSYSAQWKDIQEAYEDCFEIGGEGCTETREENHEGAFEWYESCLTVQMPMVSWECIQKLDPFSRDSDADGDGISDDFEINWLYLNPCEKCSYGGTPGESCDADLNYDRDARPNGDDTHPHCGQMIDGEWVPNPIGINGSPCV